jgi:hypothetical protein
MTLFRADGSTASTFNLVSTMVSSWYVDTVNLASRGISVDTATEDQKQTLVKTVRLTAAAGQFLHFKELMVLDGDGYNVALKKPVTGVPQYIGDPSTYLNVNGNDGIIDGDIVPLNLVHATAVDGWWEVDLQTLHTPASFLLFNRGPVGTANAIRMNGAKVSFRNAYGAEVGTLTLTGDLIQSFPVTLFPPTPSQTATPSPSPTGSQSTTRTGTPSPSQTGTPSSSATQTGTPTLSTGQTASTTGSISATASNTPTSSMTPSVTASPSTTPSPTSSLTQSPFSVHPSQVRIDIQYGQCLNRECCCAAWQWPP